MRRLFLMMALASAQAVPAPASAADLAMAVGGAFTSMDPHFHNLAPNNALSLHVFDPLVTTDLDYRPAPGLALSWKAVDDLTWEFHLRPGVTFHDGTPFSADDVAFTMERIPGVPNSPVSFAQFTRPVTRIEILDPLTLRLHTAEPVPLIPMMMASFVIVSRKNGTGATTADYNSGKAAIGTGPYRLTGYTPGDRATMQRNPSWWGPAQPWDNVSFRLIPNDSSRVAALQSGDVDVIDSVPTRDVGDLRRNPRLVLYTRASLRLIYVALDSHRAQTPMAFDLDGKPLASNPLRDVRVRRAMSLAINRTAIQRQIMDGFSVPSNQLMPAGAIGHDPTLKPDPYDPEQARKLLTEAGYKAGFALTLNGPNDRYVNDGILIQAIAQMWSRVGIRTQVGTMPFSMLASRGIRDEFSATLTGWSSSTGEADTPLVITAATPDPARGRGSVVRASHYSNPEVDRLIDRALTTIDTPAREVLYREATRIAIARDYAVLPIHHQVNAWATRKGVVYTPRITDGLRAVDLRPDPTTEAKP
jgi:peptide/nickel transport system substrate-binding protein